jgi:hypothetical protein
MPEQYHNRRDIRSNLERWVGGFKGELHCCFGQENRPMVRCDKLVPGHTLASEGAKAR